MDYETFKKRVKARMDEKVQEGGKVVINHVLKNNGMELDGLVIMEEGSNVAPTIYINSYYDQLKRGRDLDSIVDELFEIHNANKTGFKFNPELFMKYENIRNTVVYKVINYDKNVRLLKDLPHKKLLDLAVVYYCLIEQSDDTNATALIHNEHLKEWGITEDELHQDAIRNTPNLLKCCIKPMSRVLSDAARQMDVSDDFGEVNLADLESDMYVLTNSSRINGAACMLYDAVLDRFAKKVNADLYILPSSVHEVIILPQYDSYDKELLVSMVREVNADGVAVDEVLSDNVYEYNRKDKMITL